MPDWQALFLVAAAYLMGSVPCGLLVAKAFGAPDPREGGSRNIGATNLARLVGKTAGLITLLLDMAKGFVPVAVALGTLRPWVAALVGLAAFCGHCWPVYLRFKGGKGVATGLGVLLAINPWAMVLSGGLLVAVALGTRHMSLGSMVGWGSAPVWLLLLGAHLAFIIMAVGLAALVIWRHRENIARLRAGEEHALY